MAPVTREGLEQRLEQIKERLEQMQELATQEGRRFTDDERSQWNDLNEEREDTREHLREIVARERVLAEISQDERSHEAGAHFQTRSPGRVQDPFDLTTMRANPFVDPDAARSEIIERGKHVLDGAQIPGHINDSDAAKAHIERLTRSEYVDEAALARHMLVTGSPTYQRAFGKHLQSAPLSPDESRALSLASSGGGYAVPFTLDPTVIPTSNLSVNPFRAISRVVNITGDTWQGVSSAGVSAAYAAEATEASDNAPTLAQPVISTEKAQAFIPFSIEVGMDWQGMQAEMGRLLQDAKDDLEATAFATGSGTNEPQGVLTGATTVVTASGTASFAAADLYALENALGPRFRPRASMLLNRAQVNRIRAFATAAGPVALTENLRQGTLPAGARLPVDVLGYPTYELSSMASVLTTGSLIAILGDFSYYVIVERIGLTVEVIPHLVGTNRRPTGQRGLYAYWRNSGGVISPNAFRVLKTG